MDRPGDKNTSTTSDALDRSFADQDLPKSSPSNRTTAAAASASNRNSMEANPTAMPHLGAVTLDDLERLGLEAPAPLPPPASSRRAPAAPGAFRNTGPGMDPTPQQVDILYKGGVHVLGREGASVTQANDPMPPQGSIFFDNEPIHRSESFRFRQQQQDTVDNELSINLQQQQEQQQPCRSIVPRDSDVFEISPFSSAAAQETKKKPTKLIYMGVLVCFMAIATAIVVGVVVGLSSSGEDQEHSGAESNVSTTDAPSSAMYTASMLNDVFPDDTLPESTKQAIVSGTKPLPPQAQAFQWLIQHDNWSNYGVAQRRQRFVLATFYFATKGSSWFDHLVATGQVPSNGWLNSSTHECDWYSLAAAHQSMVCHNYTSTAGSNNNNKNNHPWDQHADYQSLVLSGDDALTINTNRVQARLLGSLVPELALLTNLQQLNLGFQTIRGTIPTELTQLSSTLTFINLEKCQVSGSIPHQLFEFPQRLFLNGNLGLAASSIPTTVGRNTRLTHLLLNDANVQGILPSELGLATHLQEVFLSGNFLDGSVPTEIGQLKSLTILDLLGFHLTGVIPSELGQASALKKLTLGGVGIQGTLPSSLARLSNLELLYIDCSIEGPLLPELFFVLNTTNDSNATNYSSVMTPTWPRLQHLLLTGNQISGSIPSEIGLLGGSLQYLFLDRNMFQGHIPSEIGLLSSLTCLSLDGNALEDELPTEVMLLKESVTMDVPRGPGVAEEFDSVCRTKLTL